VTLRPLAIPARRRADRQVRVASSSWDVAIAVPNPAAKPRRSGVIASGKDYRAGQELRARVVATMS
jgi:hypothetical protein